MTNQYNLYSFIKMSILSAKEMRKVTEEAKQRIKNEQQMQYNNNLDNLMTKVKDAANYGSCIVTFDNDIGEANTKKLELLGYTITNERGTYGYNYSIEW